MASNPEDSREIRTSAINAKVLADLEQRLAGAESDEARVIAERDLTEARRHYGLA